MEDLNIACSLDHFSVTILLHQVAVGWFQFANETANLEDIFPSLTLRVLISPPPTSIWYLTHFHTWLGQITWSCLKSVPLMFEVTTPVWWRLDTTFEGIRLSLSGQYLDLNKIFTFIIHSLRRKRFINWKPQPKDLYLQDVSLMMMEKVLEIFLGNMFNKASKNKRNC